MNLYHREYGPDDFSSGSAPLVLLHGLLGSSDNWHAVATRLAENYRVFVPDLRNHGRSFHSDEHNYRAIAQDMLRFFDSLELRRPIVIGHSMGGKAAMEFALENPDRAQALIIEDMIPGRTSPQFRKHMSALMEIDLNAIASRKEAEEKLISSIGNRMLVLFLLKNLHRTSTGGFTWKANIPSLAENYNAIWDELSSGRLWEGPVLLIRGERSDTVPDDRFEEVFDFFPRAKIVTIEGAGHWVHSDSLDQFISTVEDFLSGVTGKKFS